MLVLDNKVVIKKDYRFNEFKKTCYYNNQQASRFFWLQKPCHINEIEGIFKVGLWFQESGIRQIQLFFISDKITNEIERKSIHDTIITNYLKKEDIGAVNIINYWDKRDSYSTIIIDFN